MYEYADYANISYADCIEDSPEQKKLDSAAYWLESITERLYGGEPIDLEMLQYDLEEMGHILGVKIPTAAMNIEARTYIAKEA